MADIVNTEVTENDVVVSDEVCEGSDRDLLRDGLAIGAGLLALDGAVHVGKFIWTKGIKPVCNKIGSGFAAAKEKRAERKAAKANTKANEEQTN